MDAHRRRIACRPPGTACIVEVSDQFHFPGVHADHRLAGIPVVACLFVEITELGIAVGMPTALERLRTPSLAISLGYGWLWGGNAKVPFLTWDDEPC
jgi:hypothetical protein